MDIKSSSSDSSCFIETTQLNISSLVKYMSIHCEDLFLVESIAGESFSNFKELRQSSRKKGEYYIEHDINNGSRTIVIINHEHHNINTAYNDEDSKSHQELN